MAYDLTNLNISDTFQHLLQVRAGDKTIYDALGNTLDNFKLSGNLTADGNISGAGNFLIEGSGSFQEINVGDNTFTSYLSITPPSVEKDLFLVKSGSFSAFNVNQEGVVNLGGFTAEPSVVDGGFYYNTTSKEFFLGTI
jgi:hypothetical protein